MNFLKRIVVLFHVVLVMFLVSLTFIFVTNYVSFNGVVETLWFIYSDEKLKLIFGGIAGFLLLINFMFYSLFSVSDNRDKIIAFDNPSGRVSVSLIAMEDLVRRILARSSEVKEVKPKISASKKGIQVTIRMVLLSEVNIPEFTSRVQALVTKKIQDTIGIEESVDVAVYVNKILAEPAKTAKKEQPLDEEENDKAGPNVPFEGYRA